MHLHAASGFRQLKRLRRIIEFRKTDPEILKELVSQAHERSKELNETFEVLKQISLRLVDILERRKYLRRIFITDEERAKIISKCVLSVDGSSQVVGGLGGRFYIMLSSVLVTLPNGLLSSSIKVKHPGVFVIPYTTSNSENVKPVAEDLMFILETFALQEATDPECCSTEPILFIDGPIIDPPRPLTDESRQVTKELLPSEESSDVTELIIRYHEYRAEVVRSLLDRGVVVVGFVKRSKSDRLLKAAVSAIDEAKELCESFSSDEELARSIFVILGHVEDKNTLYYTKPSELVGYDNELYENYLNAGIKIYYTYTHAIAKKYSRPFRLELAVTRDLDEDSIQRLMENVLKVTNAFTLPGYEISLPVIFAHNKCSIRRGAAEVIYREIMSRASSIESKDEIISLMRTIFLAE